MVSTISRTDLQNHLGWFPWDIPSAERVIKKASVALGENGILGITNYGYFKPYETFLERLQEGGN